MSRSFIRALDEGGMVWEGQEHQSLGSHETQKSAKEGVMAPRPVRLLFVCIGNTCRSPLAAAVASALLGSHVQAESAGITETGRPAASEAIAVLQERFAIDLTTHRSRHLDEITLEQF